MVADTASGCRCPLAAAVLVVAAAKPDHPARKDQRVQPVLMAQRVSMAQPDRKVRRVSLDQLADHPAQKVRKDRQARSDRQDQSDPPDRKAKRDRRASLVLMVRRVLKVRKDQLALPVPMARRDRLGQRATRAMPVCRVRKGLKDWMERRDWTGQTARRDRRAFKAFRVRWVRLVL